MKSEKEANNFPDCAGRISGEISDQSGLDHTCLPDLKDLGGATLTDKMLIPGASAGGELFLLDSFRVRGVIMESESLPCKKECFKDKNHSYSLLNSSYSYETYSFNN
jgi:hypothetical protein